MLLGHIPVVMPANAHDALLTAHIFLTGDKTFPIGLWIHNGKRRYRSLVASTRCEHSRQCETALRVGYVLELQSSTGNVHVEYMRRFVEMLVWGSWGAGRGGLHTRSLSVHAGKSLSTQLLHLHPAVMAAAWPGIWSPMGVRPCLVYSTAWWAAPDLRWD